MESPEVSLANSTRVQWRSCRIQLQGDQHPVVSIGSTHAKAMTSLEKELPMRPWILSLLALLAGVDLGVSFRRHLGLSLQLGVEASRISSAYGALHLDLGAW